MRKTKKKVRLLAFLCVGSLRILCIHLSTYISLFSKVPSTYYSVPTVCTSTIGAWRSAYLGTGS